MWEMFSVHDDDHCGFLGQFEVRRLLKYMGDLVAQRQRLLRLGPNVVFRISSTRGLEPYKRSVAATTLGSAAAQRSHKV